MQGFTLIEVLIALVITAIVGVMSYAGLDAAIRAIETQEKHQSALNDLNTLFSIMSKDFRQAVARPVRDEYGSEEHAFMAENGGFSSIKLSRLGWRNPRPEVMPRSELQRVEYRLEDEKLIRKAWYVMDRESDEYASESVLLEKVKRFECQFLTGVQVGAAGATPGQWVDSWPYPAPTGAGASSSLPVAVELVFELEHFGEIKRLYELPDNG
jgi:general secretion pathway protein J